MRLGSQKSSDPFKQAFLVKHALRDANQTYVQKSYTQVHPASLKERFQHHLERTFDSRDILPPSDKEN